MVPPHGAIWPFPGTQGQGKLAVSAHEHPTEESLGAQPPWDLPGARFYLWWEVREEAEADSILRPSSVGLTDHCHPFVSQSLGSPLQALEIHKVLF